MSAKNILGIDASIISTGGSLTHLVELLNIVNPKLYGFKKVVIWSSKSTLSALDDFSWLKKRYHKYLDKNLFYRIFWQKFFLDNELNKEKCDLLFVPGGSFVTNFKPVVTINQNLLPFELGEIKRYGFSFLSIKFLLLRFSQTKSFKNSSGIIFLTKYAQKRVIDQIGPINAEQKIIPHGLNPNFFIEKKKYLPLSSFDINTPLKIIYVSSVEPYKHQFNVIDAVCLLRRDGIPISLDLIGKANKSNQLKLKNKIIKIDSNGEFIHYHNEVPHSKIKNFYRNADIAVFASSCETFGQILIEGMAMGLPTACSKMSAMSEILGVDGIYFDPLNYESIAKKLKNLIDSHELRMQNGLNGLKRVRKYNWDDCSKQTFDFFSQFIQK